MRNNQNGGWEWNRNLYSINKIQYSSTAWRKVPTVSGDNLVKIPLSQLYPLYLWGMGHTHYCSPVGYIKGSYQKQKNKTIKNKKQKKTPQKTKQTKQNKKKKKKKEANVLKQVRMSRQILIDNETERGGFLNKDLRFSFLIPVIN